MTQEQVQVIEIKQFFDSIIETKMDTLLEAGKIMKELGLERTSIDEAIIKLAGMLSPGYAGKIEEKSKELSRIFGITVKPEMSYPNNVKFTMDLGQRAFGLADDIMGAFHEAGLSAQKTSIKTGEPEGRASMVIMDADNWPDDWQSKMSVSPYGKEALTPLQKVQSAVAQALQMNPHIG